MHSLVSGAIVGIIVFAVALYKGRTGWHWFALSLFAFASFWLLSFLVLYVANVKLTLSTADRSLAGFAGALTAAVIVILLACLPHRPRPHGSQPATAGRRSPGG
jgi:hypothetical protein